MAFAAARIGAVDLAVAAIYGSTAINATILGLADPFYRDGILGNQTEAAHFIAGGVAIGLMLVGMVLILGRNRIKGMVAAAALVLMALVYVAAAVTVVKVGGTDKVDGEGAASAQRGLSGRPQQ